MFSEKIKQYQIILASGSPRRQQFLKDLGLHFKISVKPIEEVYPKDLKAEAITNYLAKLKAEPFKNGLQPNTIVITSDTIVWHNNTALGKPTSRENAIHMLQQLSNTTHQVITSICLTEQQKQRVSSCITTVTFAPLQLSDIEHYVDTYKPFDKAGGYGIQEWIGAIGITHIEGSYNNVVGLPTHLLYKTLNRMVNPV